MTPVLVTDFDGTMTRHDFYQLVRARWWRPGAPDPWEDYLAGRLTHFDALTRFFGQIRGCEQAIRDFAETMQLDPSVADAFERLHQAGWQIVIASAGCEWYIRHLLRNVTTPFTLHANPGQYHPDTGLKMELPVQSLFYNRQTGTDKPAIVRAALAGNRTAAFAGDGPPDLPAAKLVLPPLRFARGWLAQALAKEGEEFQPLESWAAVPDYLFKIPQSLRQAAPGP